MNNSFLNHRKYRRIPPDALGYMPLKLYAELNFLTISGVHGQIRSGRLKAYKISGRWWIVV